MAANRKLPLLNGSVVQARLLCSDFDFLALVGKMRCENGGGWLVGDALNRSITGDGKVSGMQAGVGSRSPCAPTYSSSSRRETGAAAVPAHGRTRWQGGVQTGGAAIGRNLSHISTERLQ
jgi:hypothetical protein